MVRPSSAGSRAGSIRPYGSVGASSVRRRPKPRSARAEKTDAWASVPATTRRGGAPQRPSSASSQPARRSSSRLAAPSAQIAAFEDPVTRPIAVAGASPRSSAIHPSHTASGFDATGDMTSSAAFWFQVSAIHCAAWAAGRSPPFTNPNHLPPACAVIAPPARARSSTTAAGSVPSRGSGSSNDSSASSASQVGKGGRSPRLRR